MKILFILYVILSFFVKFIISHYDISLLLYDNDDSSLFLNVMISYRESYAFNYLFFLHYKII